MQRVKQLFLPLAEFSKCNGEIQQCNLSTTRCAKITKFERANREIEEEKHFERIREYLDSFSVFN